MTRKNKSMFIYISALIYASITGFSFVFTKVALQYNDPINILAHRFIFAFISLLLLLSFTKQLSFFKMETFKKVIPLALTYPLLFFGTQTFGLRNVNSSIGGILLSVAPVFTLILSHFFLKEKAGLKQVVFVILAVSGVVFIFYNTFKNMESGNETNIFSIILLLITTLCFSLYSVMARKYTATYANLELLTVMITVGFLGFNLLAIIQGVASSDFTNYAKPLIEIKYLIAIAYLGILSTLSTSLLTNYILTYLEAAKMSVFANLGTLISIVAGALVLKETILPYHIIGAGLIIIGVIGTNFSKPSTK